MSPSCLVRLESAFAFASEYRVAPVVLMRTQIHPCQRTFTSTVRLMRYEHKPRLYPERLLFSTVARAEENESSVIGVWRGNSICVPRNTACRDEVAVYRVSAVPGKHGYVYVSGGKVIDGKEVVMGSGDWRFDASTHTLSTEVPAGEIVLVADGNTMQGTFTLHDKTVLRHITLKRVN